MENKKLSLKRLLFAILLLIGIGYGAYKGWSQIKQTITIAAVKPFFAPYVDVTSTPRFAFEQWGSGETPKNLVLSFIVSDRQDVCSPSWGASYSLDNAANQLDLDRRIARFRQLGGKIAISFGGQLNDELAVNCTDSEKLIDAYQQVINRYGIDTIDIDIEGSDLTNTAAMKRRAEAIAKLQKSRRDNGKNLAVWLTLPVSPQGLTQDGTNAIAQMLASGVDLAGVNVMTMDYGASKQATQTMQQASENALTQTHRQLKILYSQAGINLYEASVWQKIGATVMIGQNDTQDEIFSLDDAIGFNEFALSKGITRLSMWSANRDIKCGENYVNITVVSDSCSGIKQDNQDFAKRLGNGFDGDITSNASNITIEDASVFEQPDDPFQSPYQIWSDTATYLEGTKVVWHHNVYQAKWWTQGNLPDNPVLQSFETPWQLIGPVLPGESPVPQPTLKPGTYPVWLGTEIYNEGDRVLFNGIPYQAKWWTQGDSPAASSSSPDSSPWKILTLEQINNIN